MFEHSGSDHVQCKAGINTIFVMEIVSVKLWINKSSKQPFIKLFIALFKKKNGMKCILPCIYMNVSLKGWKSFPFLFPLLPLLLLVLFYWQIHVHRKLERGSNLRCANWAFWLILSHSPSPLPSGLRDLSRASKFHMLGKKYTALPGWTCHHRTTTPTLYWLSYTVDSITYDTVTG